MSWICHGLRLIFKMFAGPENGGADGRGNEAQDPYSRAERLYQDIVKSRTNYEFSISR